MPQADLIRLAAEWDCRKQLLAFYQALDESRFADVTSFFTPDCAWTRRDVVSQGHAGIARIYEGRAQATHARHIVTNISTNATSADAVDFSLCITFYTAQPGETIPTVPGPTMVLSSHGQMALRDGRWLIHRKETIREFMIGNFFTNA